MALLGIGPHWVKGVVDGAVSSGEAVHRKHKKNKVYCFADFIFSWVGGMN